MSAWFVLVLAGSSARAACVLAAGAVAAWVLRRRPAATRHLVWTLACVTAVLLPALSAVLPGWRLPGGAVVEPAYVSQLPPVEGPSEIAVVAQISEGRLPGGDGIAARPRTLGLAPSSTTGPRIDRADAQPSGPSESPSLSGSLIVAVWALGMLASSLPIAAGLLCLRNLGRTASPVTDRRTLDEALRLTDRIGLTRPVRLIRSGDRRIPMTWGVFRPVVLLPEDSRLWSDDRLTMVLFHELAHVKRWDCLTQLVARVACAVYWFNPLAWLALGRIRAEQEQACDDLVLGWGLDPLGYADHLLAIVAGPRVPVRGASLATAAASAAPLERRLVGILDKGRDRRPLGRRVVVLAALAATALVVPLAAFQPWAEAAAVAPFDEPPPKAQAPKPDAMRAEAEVLEKLRAVSFKAPSEETLRRGAIKGMLEALGDPYSAFFDARELGQFERSVQGKLTGIGVQLRFEGGVPTVISPLPGSPAAKAGIKPGDVVDAIDGRPTKGVGQAEIVNQILGPEGKPVTLKLQRAGKVVEVAVTRGTVTVRTVLGDRRDEDGTCHFLLDPAHGVGYIRILSFSTDTIPELTSALDELKRLGAKGLILDLRGCPGGLMGSAIDAAKLFLAKGKILTLRSPAGEPKVFAVDPDAKPTAGDLPMAVVVDGTTASAAEIVSGALKDNGRAIVIGARTVGKGSVQSIFKLDGVEGAIRVTSAYYELPGGANIDRQPGKTTWGVDPTDGYFVPVNPRTRELMAKKRLQRDAPGTVDPKDAAPPTPEAIETDRSDPQLAAALRTMIARIERGAFEKVGLPASEQTERARQLEDASKRRQALLDDLKRVEEQLDELRRNGTESR